MEQDIKQIEYQIKLLDQNKKCMKLKFSFLDYFKVWFPDWFLSSHKTKIFKNVKTSLIIYRE